ncbi:MAG TPA: hypothetical protein VIM59_09975 [Cellvibrio sp.]
MKFSRLDNNESPAAWVDAQLSALRSVPAARKEHAFALHFSYFQTYLPSQPALDLVALIHVDVTSGLPVIHLGVFNTTDQLIADIQLLRDDWMSIRQFSTANHLPVFQVSAPWELVPVYIPKPWGQEIWFTGIEARGQAAVKCDEGSIPLPWILAVFPQAERSLILLKVLDPLPDEVYGDLYFELHEEKQEVYVVTSINEDAWPDGTGSIQLGFSPDKRGNYTDDHEFKKAYLEAVKSYEQVRRTLDKKIDDLRSPSSTTLSTLQLKNWINTLSQSPENEALIQSERNLRSLMNSFVNHMPLVVGDTVAIPRCVPHALQHGVRVVEFQTPVYERQILSFAQKVVTQDHWDTEKALAIAEMDYVFQSPARLVSNDQIDVELIVSFDDFLVQRIHLKAGFCYEPSVLDYSLVMLIAGELRLVWSGGQRILAAGNSMLIPKSMEGRYYFAAEDSCLFLHALPKAFDQV